MADIEYSPLAINDLENIGDYIRIELASPIAALNIVDGIQDAIDNLSIFPLMGALLSSIMDIYTNYRFLVCDNYLVFYRTDEKMVYIDRVLYGKRDYLAILFPNITKITNKGI